MLRFIAPALVGIAAIGGTAHAECEEALVAISGDEEVVQAIEKLLASRGIAIASSGFAAPRSDANASRRAIDGECTTVRAHVERRGDTFAIGIGHDVERTVGELATAATVIESFVRDDTAPLLPIRPAPARVTLALAPPRQQSRALRGVQVFTSVEMSFGSDYTGWTGGTLGVCITLGPFCAAARLRHARVVDGEGMWESAMQRRSSELLVGLDVPFSLGRSTFSPGFAAGMGTMWTRSQDGTTVGETGGLRADVHATWSVPFARRWALDLSAALDLTQETRIESKDMTATSAIPDEPLALLRFGVGVRYGGL